MTMIDKIRAEIERRITDNTFGAKLELMDILSFLDTLPDEPVTDCHDLKEAAEKSARQYYVDGGYSPFPNTETASHIAGFKAGAEWMKKQIPMPEDTVIFQKGVEEGKRLMLKESVEEPDLPGLEEDKDMVVGRDYVPVDWVETLDLYGRWKIIPMKEAVEGEIVKDISNKLAVTAKNINLDGLKFGDKVRIIILPEEEEQ